MSPSPDSAGLAGSLRLDSATSQLNQMDFVIRQVLAGLATTKLVRVQAVTNAGGVTAAGMVDVLPLVTQIDGAGNAVPHGTLYALPYMRIQGGANAVILDPQVGDLGLAVFCDRDTSTAKTTKAEALPGSLRQFDLADGMYIGGVLNGVPEQYVRFSAEGVEIVSPTKITLTAPAIEFDGPTHTTGEVTGDAGATFSGDVVGSGKSLATHKHGGVTVGGGQTGVPV
jgi:phage baseplate assembly protein gpV